jgi:hypothetical protein
MPRLMPGMFDSYAEAISWVRPRWGDIPVPFRLHGREIADDGAPQMSGPFLRFISAQANDKIETTYTQECYHWRLPIGDRLRSCPDCAGLGTFEKSVVRWCYPMRHALGLLDGVKAGSSAMPRPISVVLIGAQADWHVAVTAFLLGRSPEMAEWFMILALRQLHDRYSQGPVPTRGWISGRSDAQRDAETACG